MIDGPLTSKFVWRCAWLALLVRLFVSALTGSPAESALHDIYAAERFAAGDLAGGLSAATAPLWSATFAPLVALGFGPFRAAQLLAALCGALAVVPTARLVDRLVPGQGRSLAVLLTVAPMAVRCGAEALWTSLFVLLVAAALDAFVAGRGWAAMACTAAAVCCHPLASLLLALAPLPQPAGRVRRALGQAVAGLLLGLALNSGLRLALGLPWLVLPGAALLEAGPAPDAARGGVAVAVVYVTAFRLLGLLGLLGVWAWPARGGPLAAGLRLARWGAVAGLLAPVFLGLGSVDRLVVGWLPVIAVAAAAGLAAVGDRGRLPLVIVMSLIGLIGALRLQPKVWFTEQVVGEFLALQLAPGERVVSDLPRLSWAAGMAPRGLAEPAVIAADIPGLPAAVRFVVLEQTAVQRERILEIAAPAFVSLGLPEAVRDAAQRRGMIVLQRSR